MRAKGCTVIWPTAIRPIVVWPIVVWPNVGWPFVDYSNFKAAVTFYPIVLAAPQCLQFDGNDDLSKSN